MATNFGTNYPSATTDPFLTNPSGNIIFVRALVANIPSGVAGYAIGCILATSA
jgi:hypothetical protein